jgi:hypothetical protein
MWHASQETLLQKRHDILTILFASEA